MVARGAAPAVAAAAVRQGRVSFLGASGRSDLSSGEAATDRTAFLWFSVTKLVTATAVMQLAERGLVDLDRPGSRYAYSNIGYLVLGQVIERVAGETYSEYVRGQVLEPLGCAASGFGPLAGARVATGYTRRWSLMGIAGRFMIDERFFGPPADGFVALRPFRIDGAPYGGLVGTVSDLARFLAAHLDGGSLEGRRILSEASAAAMRTAQRDPGPDPVVLYVTTEKRVTRDTVIDGGGRVAISGGGATRILGIHSTFDRPGPLLTVQNLTLRDGLATGAAVPLGTDVDGGGGAIFHLGGSVVAVNSRFIGNQGAPWGPDVAGGAISGIGVGSTVVSGCAFRGNRASNGGALGSLHTAVTIANATFESNEATGRGANSVDGTGQQVGHGGNGGALSMDGEWRTLSLCGATFRGNAAGAIGGAVFRTSYHGEPTVIDRSTLDRNTVADAAPSLAGGAYLQGTQATLTASTVSRNTANGASGLWFGDMAPGTSRADLLNVTIAGNYVRERADFTRMGLAGGLWTADVPGMVRSTTIAGNRAQFGAGIVGLAGLTLTDTIVSNTALNPYVNADCHDFDGVPAAGNGVLQWTAAGQDAPCVPGATVANPLLGPLGDNGGPTETMLPGPSSPALGQGLACPATDQRGLARPATGCDLGAVEVP